MMTRHGVFKPWLRPRLSIVNKRQSQRLNERNSNSFEDGTTGFLKNTWVFPKIVVPQNGWYIMENPIKMDDLGGTIIFGNTHVPNQTERGCLMNNMMNPEPSWGRNFHFKIFVSRANEFFRKVAKSESWTICLWNDLKGESL